MTRWRCTKWPSRSLENNRFPATFALINCIGWLRSIHWKMLNQYIECNHPFANYVVPALNHTHSNPGAGGWLSKGLRSLEHYIFCCWPGNEYANKLRAGPLFGLLQKTAVFSSSILKYDLQQCKRQYKHIYCDSVVVLVIHPRRCSIVVFDRLTVSASPPPSLQHTTQQQRWLWIRATIRIPSWT